MLQGRLKNYNARYLGISYSSTSLLALPANLNFYLQVLLWMPCERAQQTWPVCTFMAIIARAWCSHSRRGIPTKAAPCLQAHTLFATIQHSCLYPTQPAEQLLPVSPVKPWLTAGASASPCWPACRSPKRLQRIFSNSYLPCCSLRLAVDAGMLPLVKACQARVAEEVAARAAGAARPRAETGVHGAAGKHGSQAVEAAPLGVEPAVEG